MPYSIRKSGDTWVVVNTSTNKKKGTHESKIKAQRQINLLQGIKHGTFRPTGKKARK